MANLKSQGCGIYLEQGTSPESYTEIGQVVSITGPDGTASEIDVTNLASTGQEFLIGLPNEGNVSLDVVYDYATTANQHSTLVTARANSTLKKFQIRLSDSPRTTATFQAYVQGHSLSLGVDDAVKATYNLRITGAVTWA